MSWHQSPQPQRPPHMSQNQIAIDDFQASTRVAVDFEIHELELTAKVLAKVLAGITRDVTRVKYSLS